MQSITESATMTTTIIRSEDGRHRYLLKKEWFPDKKQAMLIMLMAGSANAVAIDTTTMLVVANLHKLDFGGVSIVNLFSTPDKDTDEENDRIIQSAAAEAETIIFGFGTGAATNPAAQRRIAEVLELLKQYQANAFCIASPAGKSGLHPLAPALRESWRLVPWMSKPDEAAHEDFAKNPPKRKGKGVA